MTILIANIGTSDLAVELEIENQKYFLPIDYLPAEANINKKIALLPDELQKFWDYRQQRSYIETIFYQQLGLPTGIKQTSRQITKTLLAKYIENSAYWHPKIRPVRIWGAIAKAIDLNADKAYIFVTDQKNATRPQGEEKDTRYLYWILKRWLKITYPDFKICRVHLDRYQNANELEAMLKCYYQGISKINQQENYLPTIENELILVSVKGGTEAMKTALQIQAIDSGWRNIVFIDPELSLERILLGQPSECKLTVYWRHLRSQKYRTVKQLLARWDYEGAIQVLTDWQDTLNCWPVGVVNDDEISETKELLEKVLAVLQMGSCLLNLDNARVQAINSSIPEIKLDVSDRYFNWLNLYTQCRIYWDLNQIANFLPRLSSFVEAILNYLIEELTHGKQYFMAEEDLQLDINQLEPELVQYLLATIGEKKIKNKTENFKKPYWLRYIYDKRCFLEALFKFQNQNFQVWQSIKANLDRLDYWIKIRNDIIHRAQGVSKESMSALLNSDRQSAEKIAVNACDRDEIFLEMVDLIENVLVLLSQKLNPFVGSSAPYYLYSKINAWVLDKLKADI